MVVVVVVMLSKRWCGLGVGGCAWHVVVVVVSVVVGVVVVVFADVVAVVVAVV